MIHGNDASLRFFAQGASGLTASRADWGATSRRAVPEGASSAAPRLTLPNHAGAAVEDRFDVLESDTLTVPAWRYVEAVLRRSTTLDGAVDLLWPETHEMGAPGLREPDCKGLVAFLKSAEGAPFQLDFPAWCRLREVALKLPEHFPAGELDILTPGIHKTVHFTREQVACLVANQALCTLTAGLAAHRGLRHWNDWWCNFGVWYQENNARCHNYLKTLLSYLHRVASDTGLADPDRAITFTRVRASHDEVSWQHCAAPLGSLTVAHETPQAFAGRPGFAMVDFANKDIGFGVTQTQEELLMGHNPELCVSMLLAPTLADDEAIIIRGTEVEADYARENGQLTWRPMAASEGTRDWASHEVIAIDALELDNLPGRTQSLADRLIDLEPAHLMREINKVYAGFSAVQSPTIVTGLWGCGSFGGAAQVKALVQWIAAARAGKALIFNLPPGFSEVSPRFEYGLAALNQRLPEAKISAGALLSILLDPAKLPRNTDPESIFERVLEAVDRRDSAPMEGRWLGRKDLLSMTVSAGFSDAGYGAAGQWGESGAGVMMLDASRQKVLLFKRSADTEGAGLWSIPGGARPVREGRPAPALNTAVTELREEAPPLPHGQLWSVPFEYRHADSGFAYSTFFMTLTWPQLYEPRLNWEHDEYQWFELGELTARRDLHPGVIDAIQAIGEVLPERMNEVVPGLFVGNAASAANLDLLNTHGIGHVINCAGEDCRNAHESHLRYLTFPLRDEPDSKITPLIGQAVASIKQALAGSEKVLVHCEMGRSRSVSMVMAYLIAEGATPRQALNHVRERHPDAAPNRWFLDELGAYYRARLAGEGPLGAD